MIHAHIEAVRELRPLGTGDVVVRQRTGSAGVRSGVQLQVGQSDWVNSKPLRAVSGIEQELRRPTIEAVDVVVLVLGGTGSNPCQRNSVVLHRREVFIANGDGFVAHILIVRRF